LIPGAGAYIIRARLLLFPKPSRKPKGKPRKIAHRSKFKEDGADPLKSYRRRFSDYQVICQANVCRQARLKNRTDAELAFEEMLNRLGIDHEREKIVTQR
jgi:hypothetical protein